MNSAILTMWLTKTVGPQENLGPPMSTSILRDNYDKGLNWES